jgi:hypothetical protein
MQVNLQVISFFLLKHVQCVDISPASYCFASVVITERNGKKLYGQKAIHWLPLYMAVFLQRRKVACLKRYFSCFFTRTSCELNCMSKGFSCNFLDLWDKVLKVCPVTFLTNALNQSMQVLKWLECLMFIPISQLLWSWGLSIVNFTGCWGIVRMEISLFLWKIYLFLHNQLVLKLSWGFNLFLLMQF